MAAENLVILMGYLGADADLRFLPTGDPTVSMRLATTKHWTDKEGEKQERTEWHYIVGFGQVAKFAGEYAQKGNLAYVRDELRTRKWTDKDGVERYTTEVVCRSFQLLGGKRAGETVNDDADDDSGSPADLHDAPGVAAAPPPSASRRPRKGA